jgi:hypothetical protein
MRCELIKSDVQSLEHEARLKPQRFGEGMTHGIVDKEQNHKSFALSSDVVDLQKVTDSDAFSATTHR